MEEVQIRQVLLTKPVTETLKLDDALKNVLEASGLMLLVGGVDPEIQMLYHK
ncbi:MAG: hypothetical protein JKY82_00700 [Rhizobiaceae bacterium]|nr:hypothetical protein [Rhizobiaceae bacterium]